MALDQVSAQMAWLTRRKPELFQLELAAVDYVTQKDYLEQHRNLPMIAQQLIARNISHPRSFAANRFHRKIRLNDGLPCSAS